MKFPEVGEIASTSVRYTTIDKSISYALDLMCKHDHRNVVIIDDNFFKILTVMDIIDIESSGIDINNPLSALDLITVPTINRSKSVLETLDYLTSKTEYICVVNDDFSLYGIVTHTDITSNIDPDTLMDNYRLQDFFKIGQQLKCSDKDEKTSEIIRQLSDVKSDNIIIIENKKPVGILTTKDIMRLIAKKEQLHLPISSHMSQPVKTINKNSSVKEALNFINKNHFKRAVVVDDNGELIGAIAQKELISLIYSRWAVLMKEYHKELSDINLKLEKKNKEYQSKAFTDALTGLYNRHKFAEIYLSQYKTMVQRENDLSIIILDVDNFKKINDSYGHNVGDTALRQIALAILQTLRSIDVVCRWGGEEFAVLLPTASLKQATSLAEKLRSFIEALEIEYVGHVTASFGVSKVRIGETMDDAIKRADKALYLSKNLGRNRVKSENDAKEL